jgi:hypothetical protein
MPSIAEIDNFAHYFGFLVVSVRRVFFVLGFTRCCGGVFATTPAARSNRCQASGYNSISGFVFFGAVMTDLSSDAWIGSNSEIQPERLHAIGVVSYQWNHCEFWLFQLFCGVAELTERKAWALVYDLGDIAIATRKKRPDADSWVSPHRNNPHQERAGIL